MTIETHIVHILIIIDLAKNKHFLGHLPFPKLSVLTSFHLAAFIPLTPSILPSAPGILLDMGEKKKILPSPAKKQCLFQTGFVSVPSLELTKICLASAS